MKEIKAILDTWRKSQNRCQDGVLATVVHVQGSAYRRPGARMLLLPSGERIGTISGGCLEGDVSRKAWWMTESGRPVVRIYDTRSDDDAIWEFGLGCNGVVHVLLERLSMPGVQDTLTLLERCQSTRTPVTLLTVIATEEDCLLQVGQRYWRDAQKACGGELKDSSWEPILSTHADSCLKERKSCLIHLNECDIFVEYIAPALPLVVFGAGHDAIPLVALASHMGWDVTVIDGRPAYARSERFPGAKQVQLALPNDPMAGVSIDSDTAVVMMTHSFPLDCRLLPEILARNPRYIGLLGAKSRAERLCEEAGERMNRASLHAPVGLDIGAETPETIALAIIAEIHSVYSGRSGTFLRQREGSIHSLVREIGYRQQRSEGAHVSAVCELAA